MNQRAEIKIFFTKEHDVYYCVYVPTIFSGIVANLIEAVDNEGEILYDAKYVVFKIGEFKAAKKVEADINKLISLNSQGQSFTREIRNRERIKRNKN